MRKLKNTSPTQLNTKQEHAKQGAAAPVAQEHLPATGRARAKKTRLPHQKHGADCPPFNNMGETGEPEKAHDIAMFSKVDLVMSDGEVKMLPLRIPAPNQCAVIDWVNITVHEQTFVRTCREIERTPLTDDDFICEASRVFNKIFGFGVTAEHGKMMNFYKNSWVLGDGFGFVCFGGQANTLMLVLNGTGCLNAVAGWEKRLFQFLTTVAVRPTITRIDLAHDDFEGKFITVDWAETQWIEGNMSCGAQAPNIEKRGNWHRPNGRGRTLYIGCRESGKFARFYEKGKKEGDKQSLWTRAEIELKSSDRVIPFDILLDPSAYFLGTYPCLAFLKNDITTPKRIQIKKKAATIAYERSLEIVKTQCGKYITFFRQLFNDDALFLSKISHSDPNAIPKRIQNTLKSIETCPTAFHEYEPNNLSLEAALMLPFEQLSWAKQWPTLTGGQCGLAY